MSHATVSFPRAGTILLGVAAGLALAFAPMEARAQDAAPGAGTKDLKSLQRDQEAAKLALERLDAKIKKVASRLRDRQPEEAARLDAAWEELKKRLIQDDMASAVDGLKRGALLEAVGKQKEVVDDLRAMLQLLDNEARRDPQELR